MFVQQELQQLIRDIANDPTLNITDQTTADLLPGWDSLTQINLMFAIEARFGIAFAGKNIFDFRNMGELRRFVEGQLNECGTYGAKAG